MTAPRLALWIHERTLRRSEREAVVGDLLEEFGALAERDERAARRFIWRQTLRSLAPNLRRRFRAATPDENAQSRKGARAMNGLMTDLRFALRLIRREPLITGIGFCSLAAGLALTTLLFTLANAVLFRPLPVRAPSELVVLTLQRQSGLMHNFSYPDYATLTAAARLPAGIVAYASAQATLTGSDTAAVLDGESVSGNFFSELGIVVRHGRGLAAHDDRAEASPAIVVSERFWRNTLGGAGIDGQVMTLNRQAFTIVGVAAPPFAGMEVGKAADFWVPLAHGAALDGTGGLDRPNMSWLTVVARIPNHDGREAARQELDAIVKGAFEGRGRSYEPVVLLDGARGDSMLPARLEGGLRILLTAGALVLLVACMNVANLQLARTEARRLELAVRSALGARLGQLCRLLIIDAVLLAACSGLAGVAAAALLKDRAASLIALWGQPVSIVVPIDWRVAGAAAALSGGAALVISLLAIWQMLRSHVTDGLQEVRAVAGPKRRTQRLLVAGQFALSMALLTGAALLSRTIVNLRATDLGFDAGRVGVVEVSPEMAKISGQAAVRYFEDVVRRVSSMAGVDKAAVAHVMPLDFGGSRTTVEIAGYVTRPDEDMELNFVRVTPAYFETLGIPLLQGRVFDDADTAGQGRRIIVNETMARRFWPNGDVVGRFVRFNPREPFDVEVVGVAADAHYRMVREESHPSFYAPLAQWPAASGIVHVRFQGPPEARIEELRRVVGSVNAAVPVVRASTMSDQMERNIADERLAGAIGITLAVATLVLAAGGLYATMAFLVGRRTREIGVRVALGARGADVRQMVLRDAARLAGLGIAAGLALALWLAHTLRNLLYGVDPVDYVSLAAAAAILGGAAILASWLPARRAARVDPLSALREP
jgi:predicted permease